MGESKSAVKEMKDCPGKQREKCNAVSHELRKETFNKKKVVSVVKCCTKVWFVKKILNSEIMKVLVSLESNTIGVVYEILRDH